MNKMKTFKLIYLVIVFTLAAQQAANAAEPALRIAVNDEGVFIYHTVHLPLGHGFNIYRQDQRGGEFIKLNEEPVRGAGRTDEVRPILGYRYNDVLEIFEAESPAGLWLQMRSKVFEAGLASFLYPEAALALGRLFVDREAPLYEEVTYRIEFVNNAGLPTGRELTKTLMLEPHHAKPPHVLRAENTGRMVTLHWEYKSVTIQEDDFIIQFYLYRTDPETGELELLNNRVVIRNNAYDTHQFTFESPVINTTESYVITAVDITGQQSEPSNVLEFDLIYNIPPRPIFDVSAKVTPDPWVELSWVPASEPELAGYRIYRQTDLSLPFELLTSELIPPTTYFFLDTAIVGGYSYFYFVTVVDATGNESEKGSVAMARVLDLKAPPKPSNLKGEFVFGKENNRIELSWDMEQYSENFETFIIMRRREDVAEPGAFARVNQDNLSETFFADSEEGTLGFVEGGRYRYVIYASSRAKIYSDTISTFVEIPVYTAPTPPIGVRALNDQGFRVNLTWGAASSRHLEKYTVFRKQAEEAEFSELIQVPLTTRFIRDEEVKAGTTYVYAVSATDTAGNESDLSVPDTVFFRNYTPPSSVRNLQAVIHEKGVELRWDRVAADDLLGYKVYRSNIPTGIYTLLHEGFLKETRFFDSEGETGMWYRVRAIDKSGNESRHGPAVRPISIE